MLNGELAGTDPDVALFGCGDDGRPSSTCCASARFSRTAASTRPPNPPSQSTFPASPPGLPGYHLGTVKVPPRKQGPHRNQHRPPPGPRPDRRRCRNRDPPDYGEACRADKRSAFRRARCHKRRPPEQARSPLIQPELLRHPEFVRLLDPIASTSARSAPSTFIPQPSSPWGRARAAHRGRAGGRNRRTPPLRASLAAKARRAARAGRRSRLRHPLEQLEIEPRALEIAADKEREDPACGRRADIARIGAGASIRAAGDAQADTLAARPCRAERATDARPSARARARPRSAPGRRSAARRRPASSAAPASASSASDHAVRRAGSPRWWRRRLPRGWTSRMSCCGVSTGSAAEALHDHLAQRGAQR